MVKIQEKQNKETAKKLNNPGDVQVEGFDIELDELLNGGSIDTHGARATELCALAKKYLEGAGSKLNMTPRVLVNQDLPGGECLIIDMAYNGTVYTHPILLADTPNYETNVQNSQGQLQNITTSHSSFLTKPGFRVLLANVYKSLGLETRAEDIIVCGGTTLHKGVEVTPELLVGYARLEILQIISLHTGRQMGGSIPLKDYSKEGVRVDVVTNSDKKDHLEQPVFSPCTISMAARVTSTINSGIQMFPLGEIWGYMDFNPYNPLERENERQRRLNSNNSTPVPLHRPIYNITDIVKSTRSGKLTIENILALLGSLPTIATNSNLWLKTVLNAGSRNVNPLYDFASVGYDDTDLNKSFDECHSAAFDLQAQANYMRNYFDPTIAVRLDLPMSGPNVTLRRILADAGKLNTAIGNLTGTPGTLSNSVVANLGRVPLGVYDYKGQERDIRELMNYYSWAAFVKGDKGQLQRWNDNMLQVSGDPDAVYAERLKMANEISGGSFELREVAERYELNADIMTTLANAFAANSINIQANNNNQVEQTSYGFGGGFGKGMGTTSQAASGGINSFGGNTNLTW